MSWTSCACSPTPNTRTDCSTATSTPCSPPPTGDLRLPRLPLAAVVRCPQRRGLHPAGRPDHGDRSGTVDPGLMLWLEEHEHLSPHEVVTTLEERSGRTALAGSGDMREVEAAAERGDPAAVLALANNRATRLPRRHHRQPPQQHRPPRQRHHRGRSNRPDPGDHRPRRPADRRRGPPATQHPTAMMTVPGTLPGCSWTSSPGPFGPLGQ